MRFFAVALIFFGVAASYAQTPEVPHKMHFAGMTLTIRDDARREIQKEVDALTKSQRYFNIKVERARTYFPIIEKIFREEELPLDFKYLAIQESNLIPDAVSPTYAIGFWQFKDFTAQEMGLRVDKDIDERMNIVSSTRSAARYIKQNNWYFNNWLLALQAYQMGKGGVKEALGDKYNGDSHMEITSQTYWYVKTYLANKIAFQEATTGGTPQVTIGLIEAKGKRSLSEVAREVSVDEATLKEYNKWAKSGIIPNDKPYHVSIPGGTMPQDFNVLVLKTPKAQTLETKGATDVKGNPSGDVKFHINGVLVIKALQGETVSSISKRSGLDVTSFMKFNDIPIDARIIPDTYYFVKHKKKRSAQSLYQTKPGDNLWLISQQLGVQLKYLKKYNPGLSDQVLGASTLVRLNKNKSVVPIPLDNDTDVAEVGKEAFAWSIQPDQSKPIKNLPSVVESVVTPKPTEQELSPGTLAIVQNSEPVDEKSTIIIYEVKTSDTLYGIARQFGATIKDIMEWNNKSTLTVNSGEKLKIIKR